MGTKKNKYISTVNANTLAPVGCDTHAHLSKESYGIHLEGILQRAKEAKLSHIMNICLSLENYEETKELYKSTEIDIYSIIGIHPCDATLCTTEYMERIENIVKNDTRCKGIGETGLDFYWKEVPPAIQYNSFQAHIDLAKKYSLPIILHTRDAEKETADFLATQNLKDFPLIWHCYSGSAELAQHIVEQGWYISFSGNISYPSAKSIREALHVVPLQQMLIETDSPYLAPQPKRGKQNEPSFVLYVAEAISHELAIPVQEIWQQTGDNAKRLFAL